MQAIPFNWARICAVAALSIVAACSTRSPRPNAGTHANADPNANAASVADEVGAAEMAFARSMADRDLAAFTRHLSADAVFFDATHIRRGPAEIAAAWEPYFREPKAPFSWVPDHVEVLASRDLALTTGPVIVNDRVVGRFNSIWRLEAPHTWRVVFDKGEPICER